MKGFKVLLMATLLLFAVAGPAFACDQCGGADFVSCTLSIDPPTDASPVIGQINDIILLSPANVAGATPDQILVGTLYATTENAEERGGVSYAYTSFLTLSGYSVNYAGLGDIVYAYEDPGRHSEWPPI